MSENNPFIFIPLILPRAITCLLMVGWDKQLFHTLCSRYKQVEVLVPNNQQDSVRNEIATLCLDSYPTISFVEEKNYYSSKAAIICGLGPYSWKARLPVEIRSGKMPFVAISHNQAETKWALENTSDCWILDGLSYYGKNPSFWVPSSCQEIPWDLINPRGRFERPMLKIYSLMRNLKIVKEDWKLILHKHISTLSTICFDDSTFPTEFGSLWFKTKRDSLIIFLQRNGANSSIIKVPLTVKEEKSLQLHHKNFLEISNEHYSSLDSLLPCRHVLHEIDNTFALEENLIEGQSIFSLLFCFNEFFLAISSAADRLLSWQKSNYHKVNLIGSVYEDLWENPLQKLLVALSNNGDKKVLQETKNTLNIIKSKVYGQIIPVVPNHGDFWTNNILINRNDLSITGIIDWDSSAKGLPLLDLFHLLYFRTNVFCDLHTRFSLCSSVLLNFPGKKGAIIRKYMQELSIDESLLPIMFYRYWLGEAAKKIEAFTGKPESTRALHLLNRFVLNNLRT